MSWPNDEQRAALGPSHWERKEERDAADERAIREGAEAEARAKAWASSPIGTPYPTPEQFYELDGSRRQL